MREKEIFNSIITAVGTALAYLFDGWDTVMIALVIFMALDYTTGVIGAVVQKNVSSHIGFIGILRKATILIILIVSVVLDRLLNNSTWVFRTLVCYFYIGNEAISLIKNAAKIGIPVPNKLIQILEQLKKKGDDDSGKMVDR